MALLRCTANQAGTGHKLHFQPKHPVRAKLAAINNKNGCGTAEVGCRQFGSVLYQVTKETARSEERSPWSSVWAENGAYGLSQLGWRYNGAKLSFP